MISNIYPSTLKGLTQCLEVNEMFSGRQLRQNVSDVSWTDSFPIFRVFLMAWYNQNSVNSVAAKASRLTVF
jgi:hypothetical protein